MAAKPSTRDPVIDAVQRAPAIPATEHERAKIAEARKEIASGAEWIPHEEMLARIEARRRREQGE